MKVFNFSPEEYAHDYAKTGYVHIKNGISPLFMKYLQEHVDKLTSDARNSMEEWKFQGKKQQYLFEFPKESDFPKGVFEHLGKVTGLPVETMTICERHIKIYEKEVVNRTPPPHKDRSASEITVGFALQVPEDSYLVLYPYNHTEINPFNSTAEWRNQLDQEALPENALMGVTPVRIYMVPGDVVLFRGSSIYHERHNPANTTLLYCKFNSMRLDPIGEDPSTMEQREKSLKILSSWSDKELMKCKLEVSPRLAKISRHYTRLYWKEVIQAYVGGENEFTISELELSLFKNVERNRTIDEVMARLGISHPERKAALGMFKRLAKLGGIDLLG